MGYRYETIADDLRRRIQVGELLPGQQLPSGNDLAKEYRVSLATLRQAVLNLVAEGLLVQRHGTGTYVSRPPVRQERSNVRYLEEKRMSLRPEAERRDFGATEMDTGLERDELEFSPTRFRDTEADEELAKLLMRPVGTSLLERTFETWQKGASAPFGIAVSYVPHDLIASDLSVFRNPEPHPGGTIHQLRTVGVEVGEIIDTVTARPPTTAEADQLDVRPGQAMVHIRKVSLDTQGRVVEVTLIRAPADRLELTYTTPLPSWAAIKSGEDS
ncbi:MAG: GntR family transcriptional regulator [Pseudonocardiaceae bacterium]